MSILMSFFHICFPCLYRLDRFLWKTSKHFCVWLVLYWLSFLSDCFWALHSMFYRLSSRETTTNLKSSTFTQSSSILSRYSNHCSLLSCKHFLILFNISLVPSSSTETLSLGLKLHMPLNILTPFLPSLITSSS